jgi:hypothetical protein
MFAMEKSLADIAQVYARVRHGSLTEGGSGPKNKCRDPSLRSRMTGFALFQDDRLVP